MFIHFELPWYSLLLFGFLHFKMSYFVGIVKVCRSQSRLIVSILSSHTYIHTKLFAIFVVCSLSPHPFGSQVSILKLHRIQSSPNSSANAWFKAINRVQQILVFGSTLSATHTLSSQKVQLAVNIHQKCNDFMIVLSRVTKIFLQTHFFCWILT